MSESKANILYSVSGAGRSQNVSASANKVPNEVNQSNLLKKVDQNCRVLEVKDGQLSSQLNKKQAKPSKQHFWSNLKAISDIRIQNQVYKNKTHNWIVATWSNSRQ